MATIFKVNSTATSLAKYLWDCGTIAKASLLLEEEAIDDGAKH